MSNNGGINISGIDFSKLPDNFNLNVEDILHASTAKKLETLNVDDNKKITIDDGLDKDETKYIIESINIDDAEEEISNDEINKFLKEVLKIENPTETQVQDITVLMQNISSAAKGVASADADKSADEDSTAEPADAAKGAEETSGEDASAENFHVTVQSWGSAAEDGSTYANDCLDHIMKNYYQELTPYSEEWYSKETEIMNANPGIYGDENSTGARTSIGAGGRRNTVIYDSDTITLPGIASKTDKADETVKSAGEEEVSPAVSASPDKIPEDAIELDEREKIDEENGIEIATYTDADGNIIGKRQFDGDNIMWESTIKSNEDGTTTETRSWTDSGNVQVINYDTEGKELSINTVQQDGITSEAIYSYDDNGTKTATVTYSQDGNTIGTGTQSFNTDGSYTEHVDYTAGENAGQAIDTTYTKTGLTSSMTIENTCGEEAGSGVKVTYENGAPLQAAYYDANKETYGTVDYKYNEEDNTRTEVATNLQDNTVAIVKYNAEGEEIDRCQFTCDENGSPVGDIDGNADLLTEIEKPDNDAKEDTRTVASENIIDGGRTKRVEYDNGDIEYFYRGADGKFTNKPSELYSTDGSHSTMHYNDDGKITDKHTTYNDGLQSDSTFTHNEDGSYTETITWTGYEDKDKDTCQSAVINYDANDSITHAEYTLNGDDATGTIYSVREYENGIQTSKTDTEQKTGTVIEYQYYEDGETAKTITTTKADGTVTTAEYDENGKLVSGTPPETEEPEETSEDEKQAELRADIATARAQALHAAMDRAGTDEETVKQIINNVAGQDLVDVINQYEEMYGTSLEDEIKGDFSWASGESDLLRKLDSAKSEVLAYQNMLEANPDLNAPARTEINQEMINEAQLLAFKAATSNRAGTDERVLFDMFREMEDAEFKAFLEYAKSKNVDIKATIENETSFETQKSLIQRIETLEGTQPKPKINIDTEASEKRSDDQIRADIATTKAQALHAAMDRAGTDEETVKNIINNTSGQDLIDIINEYERLFGTTLEDEIKGDFSWASGESDLLRKLDSAKSEVLAYQNMLEANPDLNAPARTPVSLEDLHKAQLQAFKAATTNRLGTDEKIIYQMLQNGSMTDADIIALNEALKQEGTSLAKILKAEFEGDDLDNATQKQLLAILKTLGIEIE